MSISAVLIHGISHFGEDNGHVHDSLSGYCLRPLPMPLLKASLLLVLEKVEGELCFVGSASALCHFSSPRFSFFPSRLRTPNSWKFALPTRGAPSHPLPERHPRNSKAEATSCARRRTFSTPSTITRPR